MFQVLAMLLECFNLLFLINYFFVVVTLFPLTRNFAPLCLCLYPGEPYSHLISRVGIQFSNFRYTPIFHPSLKKHEVKYLQN